MSGDNKELFSGMLSGLKPKSAAQEEPALVEAEAAAPVTTPPAVTPAPEGRNEKPVILSGRVPFWLRAELRKHAMDEGTEVQEILQMLVLEYLKKVGRVSD